MGISREQLKAIFAEEFGSNDLLLEDIPHIDLYIDQITTLFEHALGDRKRDEDDKILTKTMVNNYSKEGILRPIKSKKYSREHIIQMSMIYMMKQCLSIQDIKNVMCAEQYKDLNSFESVYCRYADLREQQLNAFSDMFAEMENGVDVENDVELLALMLCLCSISSAVVRAMQKIIDRYMKPTVIESKEKKEPKEKKQKNKDKE